MPGFQKFPKSVETFVASPVLTQDPPTMIRSLALLSCAAAFAGCIHVKVDPIHVTLDVNVKVDRALDDFFGDLDKKSTTLNAPAAK